MTDENKIEKAHDVDKNDPDYKMKVSDVLQRRFLEEKRKSVEREKEKMDAGRNKTSIEKVKDEIVVTSLVPTPATTPVDTRDPDEVVRRKDISMLVNQLNKSFAIIEKFRIKTEKTLNALKAALNDSE